ncbi:hypothetical protein [Desulfoscipio geothermicus]|uniref:Uncharacterized protein n=1 Tax=Desulfoscipio geothermicus DSM 3669 TaxID=1121426 RepID=A0A1I6DPR8_9FIRM|nr:hypothetical protein [Desulfoscipio geothermicus]SFR07425.1 hypothetical protein SAMN05660706_114104 [Desulfoscipio geothermicus DSM 3669]
MPTPVIKEIGLMDGEKFELKIHFQLADKEYFGILNLKNGSFLSNAVFLTDAENQELVHYLSHRAEDFLAQKGISLPPELKCNCH